MKASLQIHERNGIKKAINLNGSSVTLGRDLANDVTLTSDLISRFHAKIYLHKDTYYFEDTSTNGCVFNGRHVIKKCEKLIHGDVIQIGDSEIVFMGFALDELACMSDQQTLYLENKELVKFASGDYSVILLHSDQIQNREIQFNNHYFSIGSDELNKLRLADDASVKAIHCDITLLNSKPFLNTYYNCVSINGIRVDATPTLLSHDDVIEIGKYRVQFKNNRATKKRETYKIVTQSALMFAVLAKIERTSRFDDIPVLVTGETGSGKELVAQAIHTVSRRREKPFVSINCASISDKLAESVLFGHVKGAFTDAVSEHVGYFEQADGGTLFLDEVGELNPEIQAKLLRALEYSEIRKVGSTKNKTVNVRIIAATNRKLEVLSEREAIHFRHDLFYRLKGIAITVPALRERRDDILLLMDHFLDTIKIKYPGLQKMEFAREAYESAISYDWPGNVRELYNACLDTLIESRSNRIKSILPSRLQNNKVVFALNLPVHLQELEILLEKNLSKTEVAKTLHLSRTTVYKYLDDLDRYRSIYPKDIFVVPDCVTQLSQS